MLDWIDRMDHIDKYILWVVMYINLLILDITHDYWSYSIYWIVVLSMILDD